MLKSVIVTYYCEDFDQVTSMPMSAFIGRYEDLAQKVEEITKNPSATGPHNVLLRQLYSKLELLLLDIEENKLSGISTDSNDEFFSHIEGKSDLLKARLNLIPIDRKAPWWKWIDIVFRTIGNTLYSFFVIHRDVQNITI